MAFFKRTQSSAEDDVPTLLLQGDIDLSRGTITSTFSGRTAEAPVQVLDSHHAERGEWVWAWALDAVPPELRRDAETARAFGERTGTAFLSRPQLEVDAEGAADVTALAFRVAEATGFYRGPGASSTYFTFGEVTLAEPDGTTRTFRIRAE